jgi:hypothetical protein
MNYVDAKLHARRTQVIEVLEMVCESLELSNTQFAQAKQRYEGVGGCLAGADDPVLRAITIYLQGSTALRTTVRPIGINEHDVDLVAHVTNEVEIFARGAEEGDRRLPARERQLRAAPRRDAPLLAAELRERIPHGHHAVDTEPELPVRRRARSR